MAPPMGIISQWGGFILLKAAILAALKVAYSPSIYRIPNGMGASQLHRPQQRFFPIAAEKKKVAAGSRIHRNIRLYPMASEPSVKNQNTRMAMAQITR